MAIFIPAEARLTLCHCTSVCGSSFRALELAGHTPQGVPAFASCEKKSLVITALVAVSAASGDAARRR